MTTVATYENLYESMKEKFTVVSGNCSYTLGGYMRMKSHENDAKSSLPATVASVTAKAPAVINRAVVFVMDKMAVKEEPKPEKIMRAFPLRTALSAVACAVLACSVVLSYGFISRKNVVPTVPAIVAEATENASETAPVFDFETL